jgi:hypothetical protein
MGPGRPMYRGRRTAALGRTDPFHGEGGKVSNRRVSPVVVHSGDRLLSEPIAGTQPCRQEPLFLPRSPTPGDAPSGGARPSPYPTFLGSIWTEASLLPQSPAAATIVVIWLGPKKCLRARHRAVNPRSTVQLLAASRTACRVCVAADRKDGDPRRQFGRPGFGAAAFCPGAFAVPPARRRGCRRA